MMKYIIAYLNKGQIVFLSYAMAPRPVLGSVDFPGGEFSDGMNGSHFFETKNEADESFDIMTISDNEQVLRNDKRWKFDDITSHKLGVYEANEEAVRMFVEIRERLFKLDRVGLSREGGVIAIKQKEARRLLVASVLEQMGEGNE